VVRQVTEFIAFITFTSTPSHRTLKNSCLISLHLQYSCVVNYYTQSRIQPLLIRRSQWLLFIGLHRYERGSARETRENSCSSQWWTSRRLQVGCWPTGIRVKNRANITTSLTSSLTIFVNIKPAGLVYKLYVKVWSYSFPLLS